MRSTVLSGLEAHDILHSAISDKTSATITFMSKGKWHSLRVAFLAVNTQTLHIRIPADTKSIPTEISIDQPIGISFNGGVDVYIFEVPVVGFEAAVIEGKGGVIVLEIPENIEKMQRRAFTRVCVPHNLNVKTLFWHRGFIDKEHEPPLENYWQGNLIDLSAGGLQISIDKVEGNNFTVSQIVGVQFTPLPYQKPIIIEGQVKRIVDGEDNTILVGIEFLGIESSTDGRDKLYRIIDTVNEYEHLNVEAKAELHSQMLSSQDWNGK